MKVQGGGKLATSIALLAMLASAVWAVVTLGPDEAVLRLKWFRDGHPRPEAVSVELDPKAPNGTYIATLRNPSWEPVVVTGYVATSSLENAMAIDNGQIAVMESEERPPDFCSGKRRIAYAKPLEIQPKASKGVYLRPWNEPCAFSLMFRSSHGESAKVDVIGELGIVDEAALRPITEGRREERGGSNQTCPDGSVIDAKDGCPPPPPPPPQLPSEKGAK